MKDPAFLFYSKDFYEGTRTMLPEERACYIDLMSGRLTNSLNTSGNNWQKIPLSSRVAVTHMNSAVFLPESLGRYVPALTSQEVSFQDGLLSPL